MTMPKITPVRCCETILVMQETAVFRAASYTAALADSLERRCTRETMERIETLSEVREERQ